MKKIPTRIHQGFALPLALFALIITAIIATASVKLGLLDQNLARNQTDTMLAKQHAEITLNDAIDHVLCQKDVNGIDIPNASQFTGYAPLSIPNDTCENGLCGVNTKTNLQDPAWPLWADLAKKKPSTTGFSAAYLQYTNPVKYATDRIKYENMGYYIIEAIHTNIVTGTSVNPQEFQYRITAVGFGRNNNIYRTLQVLFRTKNQRCSYNPQATNAAGYIS